MTYLLSQRHWSDLFCITTEMRRVSSQCMALGSHTAFSSGETEYLRLRVWANRLGFLGSTPYRCIYLDMTKKRASRAPFITSAITSTAIQRREQFPGMRFSPDRGCPGSEDHNVGRAIAWCSGTRCRADPGSTSRCAIDRPILTATIRFTKSLATVASVPVIHELCPSAVLYHSATNARSL